MSAKAPADPIRKHLDKARQQIAAGNLTGAAHTLNEARAKSPRDARLFMMASLMAEKSGNIDGAFDAMQRCNTMAPDWAPGILELALLQARHGRNQEAIANAEKVAALEPRNLHVLSCVIDIAHRVGNIEMAIRYLEAALALVPGDRVLRRHLAQDLSTIHKWDESLAQWQSLINEDPSDAPQRMGRIQTLQARGTLSEALPDTAALPTRSEAP